MPSTMASALDAARVRAFVGRQPELAAFESALTGRGTQRVLFIHGPGGIGKTTLIQQFRIRADATGRPVVLLDARDIDCSADSVRAAYEAGRLREVDNGGPKHPENPGSEPLVLLLDGYDRLAQLDDWFRSEFLPSLPAESVVVIVGREPPAPVWRTDAGWRALATVHRMDPMSPADSTELLGRFAVPADQQARLAHLGRGHPLTLALLADSASSLAIPEDLVDAPDLVSTLVTQIVGEAPDEAHAMGYALCAIAWLTTEDLLRRGVGEQAGEVWSWLASRPFVTLTSDGLYPHDLVREVLDADLRRRSPERYRIGHHIVHHQAIDGLRSGDAGLQDLWARQKMFLHRHSALSAAFWVPRGRGAAAVVRGRVTDHPEIIEMVRHFDGEPNAVIAAQWLAAQPEGLSVVRSPTRIGGYFLQVFYPADPALVDADPVVRAALEYADSVSPARPGEQISIGRFLAGHDEYQRDRFAVLPASVGSLGVWIGRPLAWSFVATIDTDFWAPGFDYLGFTPRLRTKFDGREYSIFGIDWRRIPIDVWLDVMAERELTGEQGPIPAELQRPAPLSRPQFDEAVRAALRDLARPDRLGHNPLTDTRLVTGNADRLGTGLRQAILAGIGRVGEQRRNPTLGRVLDRTFVHPAPTQEAAAQVLDLPFSTYRRHLARAIDELTDVLWSVEIGQLQPSAD